MYLQRLFLKCDLLGKTQNFSIANHDSFRTSIGAVFSLIIVGIIVYFFSYFFLSFILMKNLTVVTTDYIEENPEKVSLTNASYILTISLQNPDYSVYINESIYTINLTLFTVKRHGDGTVTTSKEPIQLIKCNQYNFSSIPEYFNLMDIANLYCINTTKEIFLQGSFGQPEWTYLSFEFNKCINSSFNNNSCLSEEDINKKLDGGYVGLFVTDFSVYPKDFEHPFHLYGKNIFTAFSVRNFLDCWIYLKPIEVTTDYGIIINRIKKKSLFQYDSMKESTDHRSGNCFMSISFRLALSKGIYDRSYTKMHEIVADFGGIIKFCFVIGEISAYFFREMLYKDYILSFFYEKEAKNKDKDTSTKRRGTKSFNSPKGKSSIIFTKGNKRTYMINNCFFTTTNNNNININNNNNNTNNLLPITSIKQQLPPTSINIHKHSHKVNAFINKNNNNNNNITNISNSFMVNCITPNHKESAPDISYGSGIGLNISKGSIIKNQTVVGNDTFLSGENNSKHKIIKHKRKLDSLSLAGPCLFKLGIRKKIHEVNLKFKRVLYWFDVIHYLKHNSDLLMVKKHIFDQHQLQRIKYNYNFELSTLNDINIFNYSIHNSLLI